MEYKLVTTKDEVENALIEWAEHANAEEKIPSQALIDEVYDKLNKFSYLQAGELEQQLEDYENAYLGDDIKVGDLVWDDGECLCGPECVDGWTNETIDKDKHYNIEEVANDFVIYHLVLGEFGLNS